jgi:hypothetical protein
MLLAEQAGEQVLFRVACSFVWQGNGLEQTRHVFQNGYTLLALKCFGVLENCASASFNEATMVSGDDLVSVISEKTVGGIAVGVEVDLLDGLPLESAMPSIVAQCETTFHQCVVWFPPSFRKDFRILAQTPEDVADTVTDLEACSFKSHSRVMTGSRNGPDKSMTSRLQDTKKLLGHPCKEVLEGLQTRLGLPLKARRGDSVEGNIPSIRPGICLWTRGVLFRLLEAVPLLPHKSDACRWIRNDAVQ